MHMHAHIHITDSTTTDPVTNVTPTPSPPTATQLGKLIIHCQNTVFNFVAFLSHFIHAEAIGIGVGIGLAAAIVIGILLLVSSLAWYRKKKRRKVKFSDEKGSTVSGILMVVIGNICIALLMTNFFFYNIGTRSKLSSVSTVDGGEGLSSSPTLLINSSNGHVRKLIPAPTRKSESC